jgi:hypothetical protein
MTTHQHHNWFERKQNALNIAKSAAEGQGDANTYAVNTLPLIWGADG